MGISTNSPLQIDSLGSRPPERAGRKLSRDGLVIFHRGATTVRIGWSWLALLTVLAVASWWFHDRPRDGDLPQLAGLLCLSAALGCCTQLTLHGWLIRWQNNLPTTLVVTALGYRHSPDWTATRANSAGDHLINNALPPTFLMALSLVSLAIDSWISGDSAVERFSVTKPFWVIGWCWGCQSMLSLLPLPVGMGRGLLLASFLRERGVLDEVSAEHWANRVQTLIAAMLIALSLGLNWEAEETLALPAWPFIAMLGVLVWMSRAPLSPDYSSDTNVAPRERAIWRGGAHWKSLQQVVRGRRLRQVQAREFSEAADSARLDGILEKLHRVGMGELSRDDRRVLKRVSKRLRIDKKASEQTQNN